MMARVPVRWAVLRLGLPILFFLQTLLGRCDVFEVSAVTHASGMNANAVANKTPSDAKPSPSTSQPQGAKPPAHPWKATCAAYRSLTVSFPAVQAHATYNLQPIVDDAPSNGWTCKASEPLFGLGRYPPFFTSMFSLILGSNWDKQEEQKPNELHRHRDKHVFFAFNPCRLLPHTCNGSRGRLFKFAAKLKNHDKVDEEIDRLLATFVKLPQPTFSDAEEEADTTECLQNVLPTNTTLLYSHSHEALQQHPSSNGLGGLWTNPDISDDPTPWEPLDPKDPHKGLQATMRHTHIFCPDALLLTHITLKCPRASSGNVNTTKLESCEHVDPCLFRMILTAKAACPSAVNFDAASAAPAAASQPAATVTTSIASILSTRDKETSLVEGLQKQQQESASAQPAAPSASETPPAALNPSQQQIPWSSETQAKPRAAEPAPSTWQWPWTQLSFLLTLGLRTALCLLIFAWMIYAVRDWTQTKMQYSPLPDEKATEGVAAAASLNSYDSCVKALVETSRNAAPDASHVCEMTGTYREVSAANRAEPKLPAPQVSRRELRGLFSSPGRRFVSVWLPHALDSAAHQAHAAAMAAMGLCGKVAAAVTGNTREPREFRNENLENDARRWDWTDAINICESDVPQPTATQNPVGILGLSGYETI